MGFPYPKYVPEMSVAINNILEDQNTDAAITSLIICLSMLMKKKGKNYDGYKNLRESIIQRLTCLTNLSAQEFKDVSHLFRETKKAAIS